MHSFGYWLRRQRRALDLTQEQLAVAVSCSQFAIRKIETDERRPSRQLAARLAERLGIPPSERAAFLEAARGTRAAEPFAAAASAPAVAVPGTPETNITAPIVNPGFVGRRDELLLIDQAAGDALAGAARIVVIAGPPGIGKTALAQEAARRAADRGMIVLFGRALEEPGAPPYWPWVQLVRALIDQVDAESLLRALGAGARWIAEVVPELAQIVPDLPPSPNNADAAQSRFRLFDANATLWRRAAADRGIVLVLDDLHWADGSSLRMLEFVARETAGARLLVVGTYRDTEVDRRHPLSDTLGALVQLPGCLRLQLAGLNREEAKELIEASCFDADERLQLYERTEGHPLFLTQLARFVGESGAARARGLPAGVREAIGARLNRLSERCNRVLQVAAVIGRQFELGLLARSLEDPNEGECVAALEEALVARVIDEEWEADLYRFNHTLIRETLYDELSGTRRSRVHLRIAQAIEATHPDELSLLARHYAAAPRGEARSKAIEFARRAGEHAMQLHAYEDAVSHLRDALALVESAERMSADQAQARLGLHLRLGEAQTTAGEYLQARDSFRAASDLARHLGQGVDLARAAIGFEDASWRPGLSGEESIRLLREALDRIGDSDVRFSARVLSALTRGLIFTGAVEAANETSEQAIELARRSGDQATLADALSCGLSARWQPERLDARLSAAHEAMLIGARLNDNARVAAAAAWRLFDLLEAGDAARFHPELESFTALCEELRQPFWRYTAASFRSTLALMRGDLVESERAALELLQMGESQPGLDAQGVYATQMFTIRREQGRLHELAPVVRHFVATTPQEAAWRPGLALVFAELGLLDDARHEFERLAADDFASIPRDGMWAASMAYLADVCVLIADVSRAGRLYGLIAPYQERNIIAGTAMACLGASSRFLGMLAALAGRWDDAERQFEHALAMNARQGATTWLAHTQAVYGSMLTARGGRGDAERAAALGAAARQAGESLGLRSLIAKLDHDAFPASRRAPLPGPERAVDLTVREVDVLRCMVAGKSNAEIAGALGLSPSTVANHVRRILDKTGSKNRADAISVGRRAGLLGSE